MSGDLSDTRIIKKLQPDQAGAKKLSQRYGQALICVRYRVDRDQGKRYTTVELLVEQSPLADKPKASSHVHLRIAHTNKVQRQVLISSGAEWNSQAKTWRLPRAAAAHLKLLNHEVEITPYMDSKNGHK